MGLTDSLCSDERLLEMAEHTRGTFPLSERDALMALFTSVLLRSEYILRPCTRNIVLPEAPASTLCSNVSSPVPPGFRRCVRCNVWLSMLQRAAR
jgi:hypothetical protein